MTLKRRNVIEEMLVLSVLPLSYSRLHLSDSVRLLTISTVRVGGKPFFCSTDRVTLLPGQGEAGGWVVCGPKVMVRGGR